MTWQDDLPQVYECECDIVVGDAWWMIEPRCPEHDEPIRPTKLEPIEPLRKGDEKRPDFWVL